MDPALDNPLQRFSSFWVGLLVFVVFGLGCVVLLPLFGGKKEDPQMAAASEKRLETLAEMQAAQAAVLSPEAVRAQFESIGPALLAKDPTPMPVPPRHHRPE